METNANPTHFPYTNHFVSVSPHVELEPSSSPQNWTQMMTSSPQFRAITPTAMNVLQFGFRHLIRNDVLHPYFQVSEKNRRSRFGENQRSVSFWAKLSQKAGKGQPMHQSTWDTLRQILMPPFIMLKINKRPL